MEKTLYLKSLPGFLSLSNEAIAVVAQAVEERQFAKGETLHERGRPPGSTHLIVTGRVRASGGEYGHDTVLESGEPVGMLSMLARSEDGLDSVADTDVVTLELAFDEMRDLFEDHFELMTNQARNLAHRLLVVRKRIPNGTYLAPAEGRIPTNRARFDLVDRLVFMTQGQVFQRSSVEAMLDLARGLEEVEFPEGTTLWNKGDPSGFMYLLASGGVRCEVEPGRVFRAGAGYPVGNLESQAGEARWYTAVTETPMRALLSRTDTLLDILEDHFETAMEFLAAMARGTMNVLLEARSGGAPVQPPSRPQEDTPPGLTRRPTLRPFLPATAGEEPKR